MGLSGLFAAITPAANGIPRADGTGLIDLGWVFAAKGANTVFAGPASGSDAMPGFRALVADDIPDLSSIYVPIGRKVDTGDGLTGGGDLSADRTLSVTGNLLTLFDLADGSGWLHNDGSGALAYSTPTPAEIGLSAGNSITLTGGVIDTIQDIRTTATPTFAGMVTTDDVFVAGQYLGGFGAMDTSGITDWNDVSNARSGSGFTLLLGTADNGPGPDIYFHPFSFEYAQKDGTGQLTQLAIPYAVQTYASQHVYLRGRYLGEWYPWRQILTSDTNQNFLIQSTGASTSPITGALVVAGGVGVGGDINIGGNMDVSGIVGFGRAPQTNYGLVIQSPTAANLGLSIIESTGAATISLKPNVAGQGVNLITSDYFSGSTLLPLHLSARGTLNDFVVDTNGNIGIGTASPAAALHVVGSISFGTYTSGSFVPGSTGYITITDSGGTTRRLIVA